MSQSRTDAEIIAQAVEIAATQLGGSLATMHAEDGTPYVTFVFFHLDDQARIVFGSLIGPQHYRNMEATPEVSFLIDNRDVLQSDWKNFNRVVVEGHAERIPPTDSRFSELIEGLREKNKSAASFAEQSALFCIYPRRLQLRTGLTPERYAIEFPGSHR